jgi:hypothetical protein
LKEEDVVDEVELFLEFNLESVWGQIFILEFTKHTGVIYKKLAHWLIIGLLSDQVVGKTESKNSGS